MIMQSQSSEIQGKQISFMQKCIIMANIFNEENKFVVNPFNNIPYVKLYTANLTIEKFVYTKIKGALILIYEENKGKTDFFLQIYDINDYSLVFSLPINKKLLEGVIILEETKKTQEAIHSKGFDMIGGPITDYNKMKIGLKTVQDAVLELGTLKDGRREFANKKDVMRALASKDLRALRAISNYFYRTNGIYQKVVNYFATMYRFD